LNGLKDIPKSGRPTEIPEEIGYEIKTILTDSNQGWTTKQVEELITKERKAESNIILITYTAYFVDGVLNRRYQERFISTLPLQKKRMNLKKGQTNICRH
jgi:hypothetical protein